jgi:hypothetical protein
VRAMAAVTHVRQDARCETVGGQGAVRLNVPKQPSPHLIRLERARVAEDEKPLCVHRQHTRYSCHW